MQDSNPPLAASDLQLQYILGTSPAGMRIFNDREEIIAANPPAEQNFAPATQSAMGLILVRMFGQHQLGGLCHVEQRQGTSFPLTFTPREGKHAHA